MGTRQFFSVWRIARMDSTSGIGPAMFHPATARRAFREARSPTRFFRGSRHLRIWRESIAPLTSILIWRLSFGLAPAFQRPTQNAACNLRAKERRLGQPRKLSGLGNRESSGILPNEACLREVRSLKRA